MPQKSLSTLFVKNVKPDPTRVTDYSDRELDTHGKIRRGFLLRVSPLGHKSWVARLRYKDGPKQGYVYEKKIGEYPQIGLAEARSTFDQWKYHGIPEAKPTVNKLCDQFIAEWSKPRKRTWEEDKRQLDNEVRPAIGDMPIDEVTRKDIKAILNNVNDRGAPCSANSLLAVVRKMFNWAIDVDLLEASPCNRLKLFPVEHHRSYLNESELKTFLQQLPTADMPETLRQVFMFQLQTCSRVSEARGARWDEIDLEHGIWTIPKERSKNKLTHRVMLSKQSIQLLQDRHDNGSDFVFPYKPDRPYRLDIAVKWLVHNREHLGMPDRAATHALRHTALTQLATMGCGRELRDRISNHKDPSIDSIYQHYEHDKEAKEWWQKWADRISLWQRPMLKAVG